ncbi:hypothetical protein [uncultured Methanobrevibacter sp.]|uniref:hypothetical protein n=1 Tax=uncultured Methanobrevibacter sp. TaxID=253161 RepID=UPI0025F9D5A5|nr:hypothetical protein [uncultured Methanobrevibacter sp.]
MEFEIKKSNGKKLDLHIPFMLSISTLSLTQLKLTTHLSEVGKAQKDIINVI